MVSCKVSAPLNTTVIIEIKGLPGNERLQIFLARKPPLTNSHEGKCEFNSEPKLFFIVESTDDVIIMLCALHAEKQE